MHISEGVLSPAVLGAGAVLAAAGIVIGLRKLDYDRLMTVAILAAAFFVGSLIHVPIGPSSVHLILNGLLGMLLGWAAFPSIFVALMLQAILFQYGGHRTWREYLQYGFSGGRLLLRVPPHAVEIRTSADCRRILLRGSLRRRGRAADGAVAEFQR